jgi:hypothetical protein
MEYIEKFKQLSADKMHGDKDYFSHCINIYNILIGLGADTTICKAGLYHSIYGNDYFDGISNISRDDIRNIIGDEPEELAFIFCQFRNRFQNILENTFKLPPETDKALTLIEYANLKEQSNRAHDSNLLNMCDLLMQKLNLYNANFEHYMVDNKELFIFDNVFERADVEYLNQYCLNSVYKPEHSSSEMNYERDSRFAATMSPQELKNAKILPAIKKICSSTQKNLYLGHQYINHYGLNTSVSEHCDSSFSGQYTILIYPNKYWEDSWGGEIAFYNKTNVHRMINFKPGRVLMFDSRISHKVLPITINARKDRYSIAVKCCDDTGLENFEKICKVHTKVEKNV